MKFIRLLFLKKEDGKEVINRKKFFFVIGSILGMGVCVIVFSKIGRDSSVVVNSAEPIDMGSHEEVVVHSFSPKVNGVLNASQQKSYADSQRRRTNQTPEKVQKIEYKAQQVIERKGTDSFTSKISIGTNLIGKLLTGIDTREVKQLYKVFLPYGGRSKHGGSIPKNSILFGSVNYPGKGKKVFMQFSKALLPDGKEVELKAQALNAKDYSPGLVGKFHGKAIERVASTLGLTMVSAITDTLTEKQAFGAEGAVTPKATAKNALYQGIAKASELEAQRQMAELGDVQEYVTIPAGQDLIVNLVATYRGASKRQTSPMSGANE